MKKSELIRRLNECCGETDFEICIIGYSKGCIDPVYFKIDCLQSFFTADGEPAVGLKGYGEDTA